MPGSLRLIVRSGLRNQSRVMTASAIKRNFQALIAFLSCREESRHLYFESRSLRRIERGIVRDSSTSLGMTNGMHVACAARWLPLQKLMRDFSTSLGMTG